MSEDLSEIIVQQALEALEEKDSFEAITFLASSQDPLRSVSCFTSSVRELNSQRKLAEMLWIGRAGVEFCLLRAEVAEATDAGLALKLREAAITLAYNVSANTWPGWGDEGVQATRSDLLAALDLAKVQRRLVNEFTPDKAKVGNACWLVGAQSLAVEREQVAKHEFDLAERAYEQASQPESASMARGYQGLALKLMGTMAAEGRKRFDGALAELEQLGTDDAGFFADQLRTAAKALLK